MSAGRKEPDQGDVQDLSEPIFFHSRGQTRSRRSIDGHRGDVAPALLHTRANHLARLVIVKRRSFTATNHAKDADRLHSCEPPVVNTCRPVRDDFQLLRLLANLCSSKMRCKVSADFRSPRVELRPFRPPPSFFRPFPAPAGAAAVEGNRRGGSRFQQSGNQSNMSGDSDSGGSRCSGLLWL